MGGEAGVKVILSRKGFDSGYGGVPSPILPDGRMISLPIPDRDAPTAYAEVHRDGINLGALASDLTKGEIRRDYRAHLDPDLDPNAVARRPGWRPIFGQQAAALGHLRNEGVGPGDLFLFFGWFRSVEQHQGQWRYVRGSRPVHAIWGWMQIGAIHACRSLPADVASWAAGHPHLHGDQPDVNDVFVAADGLAVGGRRQPGAGTFTAGPSRLLTVPGMSPSHWKVPAWMHPTRGIATLSYHGDPTRWTAGDEQSCQLASVAKGQEFVLKVQDEAQLMSWLEAVFDGGAAAVPATLQP